MLEISENVDIREYCTLKIGGKFKYFAVVRNVDELKEAADFARGQNLRLFILGGGSNLVFSDGILDVLAIKIQIKGSEILNNTDEHIDVKIYAGENWDEVVERTVARGFSGIEALSAIPGTVGATPVQNVGAYGQEVKNTILSVEVFDTEDNQIKELSNADCQFSYRDSIFKHEGKGKYAIISVTFRLSKYPPEIPAYHDVKKYFLENGINSPTLLEIREAIISIRKVKLPDPTTIFNVGSFFKNPIVARDIAKSLKSKNPDLVIFPIDEERTKVPAGWLIEQAGLKGKDFGPLSIYSKNALVLVNNGNATYKDAMSVRDEVIKTVFEKFGITLEQEPEIVK